jgi:hypothetical protein
MKIKIKVKHHDYDDPDVTVEIDDKEFYPNLPTINNSNHSCGVLDLDDVSYAYHSNKGLFSNLSNEDVLKLTLLCSAKAVREPIIEGSIVSKERGKKKETEIIQAFRKLKAISLTNPYKNPNSGNTIVAFQFGRLPFIKENKL